MAVSAAVILPLSVSCTDPYDDSELREQIEMIINKLYELEEKMNSEIEALEGMLAGKIMIKDVSTDTETGITTVTLTNGSKLQLYPQKDMKSFVTYITSGGVDYWAYIDENGKKQYFLNEEGEAIPVKAEMPEVIVRDDEAFLVIGGVEYPLGGSNSVFSDYEVIKDELTDEVLAVTFTFGENMTFTVTVDNAAGLLFVQTSGMMTTVLKDYYVTPGTTAKVQVQAIGVVDYVLQIPDGWRVKDGEDAMLGKYFEITAPEASLVESGVAAEEGELKVVAVLQGGKATVAKLNLTTKPFKEFVVSAGNATVRMNTGLVKYVYGVCDKAEYDEATIFAAAEALLGSVTDAPDGYGITNYDLEAVSLAEIAGSELVAGHEYVFWVIPAAYSDAESKFYLKPGTIQTTVASYGSVKLEVKDASFRDATMDMALEGASSYYFTVMPKADYDLEHILYLLNTAPETFTLKTEPMTYAGSVFEFAGVKAVENTEYVALLILSVDGRDYVKADVIVKEFATLPLVPGSTVTVTATEKKVSHNDVETTLTAAGAEMIFYLYDEPYNLPAFADAKAKAEYVLANGKSVAGETADVKASDCLASINKNTELILLALATDATGKYSEVIEQKYTTTDTPFNDLVVNLSLAVNSPDGMKINISTTGGEVVEYLYWIGKTTDNSWSSPNLLGGSAEKAQVYMANNPTANRFVNTAKNYPIVDGVITITDHELNKEYVVVAMAKDAEGLYSQATALIFTTHAVNMGNIVYSTDSKWSAAKSALKLDFIKERFWAAASSMAFGNYSYNVTAPEGFTAYIVSGSDSWFESEDATVELSLEEKIGMIIQAADARRDTERYIDGVEYFYTFEHGDPSAGTTIIWANEEFHDANCKSETCLGNVDVQGTRYGNPGTIHHVVYYNDGTPVMVTYPYAAGNTERVIDRVFIVLQDLDGNCYAPFEYDVPFEYFRDAGIDE